MGRAPCCEKVGLKRGRWTDEEDRVLTDYIRAHGEGSWRSLPKNAGLLRCGKSCRLRWINYLRSDLKRGNISSAEEDMIIKLHESLGNRWSIIAGNLPGRTDNEIKNYWNSHLMKKIPTPVSEQPQQETPVTHHLPKTTKKPRGNRPKKKTKSSRVVEEIVPMTEEEQETFGDGGLILSDSAFNDNFLFRINVFNDNFDGGMLEFWETEMEKMDMSWLWEPINDQGESHEIESDKQNAMVS